MARSGGRRSSQPVRRDVPARPPAPATWRRAVVRGWQRPWILVLAAVTIAAASLLGGVLLTTINDRDWHVVATADGTSSITRADLHDRIALEVFLGRRHGLELGQAVRAGRLSDGDAAAVEQADAAAASDEGALQGLLDDRLIDLAGGPATDADAGTELLDFLTADARLHIGWVELDGRVATGGPPTGDWPRPGTSGPADGPALDAIAARLGAELAKGTDPTQLAAGLRAAGWQAKAGDTWAPTSGAWDDLNPTILAEARSPSAKPGALLAPVLPAGSRLFVGRLLEVATPDTTGVALTDAAHDAGVSPQVLASWAASQARRRALTERLVTSAATTPIDEVRGEELPIAAVPAGDPTAVNYGLSQLLIDRVAPDTLASVAGASATSGPPSGVGLIGRLAAMDDPTRLQAFDRLIGSANVGLDLGSTDRSGPIGWFTKGDLIPPIAAAISSPSTTTEEVLGPFDTPSGRALFLVTGRYVGALDDQSSAALTQVLATERPDFDILASQFDPADIDRVDARVWHSRLGFAHEDSNATALFGTPIGQLSDPIVINDRLELVRVDEHRLAPPDANDVAAYRLIALDEWLTATRTSHHAWADPDPFAAGLASPGASPTEGLTPSESTGSSVGPLVAPTIPAIPTPVLPDLPTPFDPNG